MLKAGDEIRSLARFNSAQRTAFRKLLKKYKKWTGSSNLEMSLRKEILDDPKSFTTLDLGPLLDDYSGTLQNVRTLYESRLQQASSCTSPSNGTSTVGSSVLERLQSGLKTGSRLDFDTAFATVPLSEAGALANYFVHPDNIVELQVLLLHYLEFFISRSGSNSVATPGSASSSTGLFANPQDADYFMLAADNLERYAQEQSAVTVNEREHVAGISPQRTRAMARWTVDEDAVLAVRSGLANCKTASMKKKNLSTFFDRTAPPPRKNDVSFADGNSALATVREDLLEDPAIEPIFQTSSCRSRFVGVNNGSKSFLLATLDSSISMERAGSDSDSGGRSNFPFAVLKVRQEGVGSAELLQILDNSHLVERVRGFSLQYHALWETCKPSNISPPFWLPILSRDIRKLPPPALPRSGNLVDGGSGSRSATNKSTSTNSALGITDTSTAVETTRPSSSAVLDQLEAPPLRSFRKKRRRTYAEPRAETNQRYWSEYDYPEDGGNGEGYVLYIDPNERSTLDVLFDKLGSLFARRQPEEEALLQSSGSPKDDETSSDEEETSPRRLPSYGTVSQRNVSDPRSYHASRRRNRRFLPQVTAICLVASIAILIMAYILVTTSKHKYATRVDAGIIFSIVCSSIFALVGFIALLRRKDGSWLSFSVAVTVLIVDAIFSGGLLAWMLG